MDPPMIDKIPQGRIYHQHLTLTDPGMELTIITKSSTYNGRTIKTGRTVLKSIRAERELRPSSSSPQLSAQPAAACNREENGRQEAPILYSQKNQQENIDADLVVLPEDPKGSVEDY